jgi:hypothetical protein
MFYHTCFSTNNTITLGRYVCDASTLTSHCFIAACMDIVEMLLLLTRSWRHEHVRLLLLYRRVFSSATFRAL